MSVNNMSYQEFVRSKIADYKNLMDTLAMDRFIHEEGIPWKLGKEAWFFMPRTDKDKYYNLVCKSEGILMEKMANKKGTFMKYVGREWRTYKTQCSFFKGELPVQRDLIVL